MKRLLVWLSATFVAAAAYAENGNIRRHETSIKGEYIVALVERNPAAIPGIARSIAAAYNGVIIMGFETALGGFSIAIPEDRAARLARDPRVRFVEENYSVQLQTPVNISATQSAYYTYPNLMRQYLWHLDRIDQRYPFGDGTLNANYTYCSTGLGVVAYVIDIGVWENHEQLQGAVIDGHDFYAVESPGQSLDPCATDGSGWHGTAVASLIVGKDVGVAKDADVVSLRVGSCTGFIPIDRLIGSLNWIINRNDERQIPGFRNFPLNANINRPGVVNISGFSLPQERALSVFHDSYSIEIAVRDVVAANFSVVTSANNYNSDAANYAPSNLGYRGPGATGVFADGSPTHVPACVITAGATQYAENAQAVVDGVTITGLDQRWDSSPSSTLADSGSNSGASVSIWAPGADIFAARHRAFGTNVYGIASGTSFSAPIVAGVVARYLQKNTTATPLDVYNWMDANATKYEANSTTTPRVRNTRTVTGADTPGIVGMLYWSEPCRTRP